MKKMMQFVVGGTRGGPMRLKIIELITKKPRNTNEITKALGIDYKTTEYHLRVLVKNGLVLENGSGYGSKFTISPFLKGWEKVHKQSKKNKK